MSVGVAISISIGIGVTTTGISYFGCGFSLARSLTLGVLAGTSALGFFSLLTPIFATTTAGVTVPALLWAMPWFARTPIALVTLSTFFATAMEVALNVPGYFYSPEKAKKLNSAWLLDFLMQTKGQTDPEEIMEAYLALTNMLMYAAEYKSDRYYMLSIIGSSIGLCDNISPCGDWANEVFDYQKNYMAQHPKAKDALKKLGMDIVVNEWKPFGVAAHYTVGITFKNELGELQEWEIDNGYAWSLKAMICGGYFVGVPFPRKSYDPNGNLFQKIDPERNTVLN
jgi:hypothetical protein